MRLGQSTLSEIPNFYIHTSLSVSVSVSIDYRPLIHFAYLPLSEGT